MRAEPIILASVAICLYLTFYFSYLSFQTTEDPIKKQFTLLAMLSLIAGVVLLASFAIYIVVKKAFTRVEQQTIMSEPAEYYEEQREKEREI